MISDITASAGLLFLMRLVHKKIAGISRPNFGNGSGDWIRTSDRTGMNRVL
jgi:hypothetical protein